MAEHITGFQTKDGIKKYDYNALANKPEAGADFITGVASGEIITMTDATNRGLRSLNIYGKTTQGVTPTLEAPVELVSAGDSGSITITTAGKNESQSMTVATPNGLPGIPVASGGNYTDANGKQWFCDEIDFARGVYVKRIGTLIPQSAVRSYDNSASTNRVVIVCADAADSAANVVSAVMCDSLPTVSANDQYSTNTSSISNVYGGIAVTIKDIKTEAAVIQWLVANPIKIQYALATPVETPLSEEELAAYTALRTYRGNTTVSNDAGAYMELEYVMDAKQYIDSLIESPPARLGSVTIPASAWKTEAEGLHSQVVIIASVTPYSKVDLLPSVEQLAIFHNKDVTFVTENENGVVTIFAIGDKPAQDYTMQVSITEVVV
jgi:hypothetical protein